MKIHLHHSDDPLTAGTDIEALCGKTVARAAFALTADLNFPEVAHLNSAALCTKCYLNSPKGKGRYLYAIAPGEEALHANTD